MAVKENRQARVACKCVVCNHKWIETAAKVWSESGGYWTLPLAGTSHRCTLLTQKIEHECELLAKRGLTLSEQDLPSLLIQNSWIRRDYVKGVLNSEVKCDARCLAATGKSCECACGGRNHGGSTAA